MRQRLRSLRTRLSLTLDPLRERRQRWVEVGDNWMLTSEVSDYLSAVARGRAPLKLGSTHLNAITEPNRLVIKLPDGRRVELFARLEDLTRYTEQF